MEGRAKGKQIMSSTASGIRNGNTRETCPLPVKPNGHPEKLKSLKMKIGGRWINNNRNQIDYGGGYVRYIHNIDPDNFTSVHLILSTQMMLLDAYLPSRMWFLPHGKQIPRGLVPINGDNSLREMWRNCEENNTWMASVFMQDVEFVYLEESNGNRRPSYSLPKEIPRMNRYFDPMRLHADASMMHRDLCMLGDPEIARRELHGERWYIHIDSKPEIPWDPIVKIEPGSTIRFMMQVNHLWYGYYPNNIEAPRCTIQKIMKTTNV